jgi:hypothetical protein
MGIGFQPGLDPAKVNQAPFLTYLFKHVVRIVVVEVFE